MKQKAYIVGTASYLPERVLSNYDLEKLVDTSNEWILSRTGISERRIAAPDESASDMGLIAAERVLSKFYLDKEKIDLILVATLSPDYLFPSTACLIQSRLGAVNAAAMDIQAACSGMIYALSVAKSYIESGEYETILVVATEKLSSIINYEDRNTCVLFGDGASSCLVRNQGPGLALETCVLGSDGHQAHLLSMPAGGSRIPASVESVQNKLHYLQMDGKELFRHAVRRMEGAITQCLEKAHLEASAIDYLIPHQANLRIIDALMKRFQIPEEKVVKTIRLYGNTSASSIGITLDVLMEKQIVQDKNRILTVAFGAGLTWGAMLFSYEGGSRG